MSHSATKTKLAAVLIAAALAALPAAGASAHRGTVPSPPSEEIYVNPSTGYPSSLPATNDEINVNPSTGFAAESSPADEPRPAAGEAPSSTGFDWPSAAIGAAGGTALLLMLLAATPMRRRIVATPGR
jgi:hypothetical protein